MSQQSSSTLLEISLYSDDDDDDNDSSNFSIDIEEIAEIPEISENSLQFSQSIDLSEISSNTQPNTKNTKNTNNTNNTNNTHYYHSLSHSATHGLTDFYYLSPSLYSYIRPRTIIKYIHRHTHELSTTITVVSVSTTNQELLVTYLSSQQILQTLSSKFCIFYKYNPRLTKSQQIESILYFL